MMPQCSNFLRGVFRTFLSIAALVEGLTGIVVLVHNDKMGLAEMGSWMGISDGRVGRVH